MMGTGTSNKDASRSQQAHGAVIDFFIASECAFKTFFVFCKCRRVKNDGVISCALPMPVAEIVESVRLDRFDVRQGIAFCIGLDEVDGRLRDVDGFDVVADLTDLKSKTTGIGERIQRFSARIPSGSLVIFALIQIGTGFLPFSKRDNEFLSVLVDGKHFRQRITDEFLLEFETLELPHLAIISKENGRRFISFAENVGEQGPQGIRCLNEVLNDKPVVVSVDNEPGQKVAFGINTPAE